MNIKCAHTELVPVDKLIMLQNPKNNNKHPKEQIERLAKIIDFAGQRRSIVISKRSGFIIKGHCTLQSIAKLGWDKAAVDYQDYETEAAEYQDMTADNEIARWAKLDIDKIKLDLKTIDLGDFELLGLESTEELFSEPKEADLPNMSGVNPTYRQRTFVLTDEQNTLVDEAMKRASDEEDCTDEVNENKNSNQLVAALRAYVQS
jgi:hypothetical protein